MGTETLYLQQMMESTKRPANVLAMTSGKAAKLSNIVAIQPYDEGFLKKVVTWFF